MFVILILLAIVCYLYNTWIIYSYWKNKGVKGPRPLPVVGNYGSVFFTSKTEAQLIVEFYNAYPEEKFIGIYKGAIPLLLVKDLDIIKQMYIKEEKIFLRPPITFLRKLNKTVAVVPTFELWKTVRQTMEPLYHKRRYGKVTHLIERPIKNYLKFIDELVDKDDKHEIYSLLKTYTLEILAVLAFNKELHGFKQESEVLKLGKIFSDLMIHSKIYTIATTFPSIMAIMKPFAQMKLDIVCDNVKKLTGSYINSLQRGDDISQTFLDYLLKGKDKITNRLTNKNQQLLVDDDFIIQQCATICLSYDSIANAMSYAFYELAVNEGIQDKAYEEIVEALEQCDGEFRADAVYKMKYLEMVFDESLRLHTPGDFIDRQCTAKYTFPGTDICLDKGVNVYTVIGGIHLDPKYFPNPEVFDPQRFSQENRNKIPRLAYMPFGDGPRECLGNATENTGSQHHYVTKS